MLQYRTQAVRTDEKGFTVIPVLVAMVVILAVAGVTAGLVVMGMEGRGQLRAPKLAGTMARAARHLNGDGQPSHRMRARR